MTDRVYIESFIRGTSVADEAERQTYCRLTPSQPLLMHSAAPASSGGDGESRLQLTTLIGQNCGWLAHEDCPRVLALIDQGHVLLCRTNGPCACLFRKVVIWSEGTIYTDYEIEHDKFTSDSERLDRRIKVPLTDEAKDAVVVAWNRLWNQYFGSGAGHS